MKTVKTCKLFISKVRWMMKIVVNPLSSILHTLGAPSSVFHLTWLQTQTPYCNPNVLITPLPSFYLHFTTLKTTIKKTPQFRTWIRGRLGLNLDKTAAGITVNHTVVLPRDISILYLTTRALKSYFLGSNSIFTSMTCSLTLGKLLDLFVPQIPQL